MNEVQEIRELTDAELDTVGGGDINISVGLLNVLSENEGVQVGVSQSSGFGIHISRFHT